MQYEKLYNLYEFKTICTDKIAVRDYVRERIGKQFLIPIYGIWDKFDEIDFSELPDSFVLKTNHGSGMIFFVDNKHDIDLKYLRGLFNRWLKLKFQYKHFEMHYAGIKPKIYAEEKLKFVNGIEDYKFLCFDGVPYYCWIDFNRFSTHKRNIYDMDWKLQKWNQNTYGNVKINIEKPENFKEMIEIARVLSSGISHVRIDLYNINGRIYFGEMTFTNAAGLEAITPRSADLMLGSLWTIKI